MIKTCCRIIILLIIMITHGYAGIPSQYGEKMVVNKLIEEGYENDAILEIMKLPRWPHVDNNFKLIDGKQVFVKDDLHMAAIYKVEGGCSTLFLK